MWFPNRPIKNLLFLGARAPIGIARLSQSLSHSLRDQKVSELLDPACKWMSLQEFDTLT